MTDIDFKIAEKELREEIIQLRLRTYAETFKNQLNPLQFNWSEKDQNSIHFVAIKSGRIVSALRLTAVKNVQEFRDILLTDPSDIDVEIPCFVLGRAATDIDFQAKNLSMHLRLLALDFIAKNMTTEKYLFGLIKENSVRSEFLIDLGYEKASFSKKYESKIISNQSFRLIRLNLSERLNEAKSKLSTFLESSRHA